MRSGTTDVNQVWSDDSPAVFDMLGNRVQTMLAGSIYIVNGRKMIAR